MVGWHLLVLLVSFLVVVALDLIALVHIWRDDRRGFLVRAAWTIIIVALPVLGGVGWVINAALGRAGERLNRTR